MSKVFSVELLEQLKKLDTSGQLALAVSAVSVFGTGFYLGNFMSSQSAAIEVEKATLEMKIQQFTTDKVQADAAMKVEQFRERTEAAELKLQESQQIAADLRSLLDESVSQIFALRIANLLVPSSPYPIGLEQVRIGDPISKAANLFQNHNIIENKRSLTVNNYDPLISQIYYGHSFREDDGLVNQITFNTRKVWRKFEGLLPVPDDLFSKALTRTLGEPRLSGRDKECLWWSASADEESDFVYHVQGSGKYEILRRDATPPECQPFYDNDGKRID
jgi:hypothetical protein